MIGFSALGHMVRDGFPALGSTLAARLAGAGLVFLGCWLITDYLASVALAIAVGAGFYTDMQHGEASRGDWTAGVISGCTSLTPLAAAATGLHMNLWWLAIVLAGLAKPPIWQLAWWLDPGRYADDVPAWAAPLTEPTRVAAIIWGALVGVILVIIAITGGAR